MGGKQFNLPGEKHTINKMWTTCDKWGYEKVEVLFDQNTVIKDGILANSNVMWFWVSERVEFGTLLAIDGVTSSQF